MLASGIIRRAEVLIALPVAGSREPAAEVVAAPLAAVAPPVALVWPPIEELVWLAACAWAATWAAVRRLVAPLGAAGVAIAEPDAGTETLGSESGLRLNSGAASMTTVYWFRSS